MPPPQCPNRLHLLARRCPPTSLPYQRRRGADRSNTFSRSGTESAPLQRGEPIEIGFGSGVRRKASRFPKL